MEIYNIHFTPVNYIIFYAVEGIVMGIAVYIIETIRNSIQMREDLLESEKMRRKQLEEMAYHDPLTGLHNRLAIQQKLEDFVATNDSSNPVISCVFIDVDDFKFINDTYGHDAGGRVSEGDCITLAGIVFGGNTHRQTRR
ncbi:GGDEF domain-containing protein [Paenibacillus filicis]|uniref:GGDEF domain-containing protein n=1 Tax=Paenibacillus gyeongsangnamensis TaxID=3388067 RepID=A0ABT4QI99_9BACL|nr:GGDEF domain-containing protein [Paenibacillus filicis]MCZ8516616.1 GGDEF domain-containing protein [Paenibacillus filicis]